MSSIVLTGDSLRSRRLLLFLSFLFLLRSLGLGWLLLWRRLGLLCRRRPILWLVVRLRGGRTVLRLSGPIRLCCRRPILWLSRSIRFRPIARRLIRRRTVGFRLFRFRPIGLGPSGCRPIRLSRRWPILWLSRSIRFRPIARRLI